MDWRVFLGTLAGGLFAAPLAGLPQPSTRPVVGYLSSRAPGESAHIVAAFRRGLEEGGFVDGRNVTIDQRAKIVALAFRHKLPAVYPVREFADAGAC